MDSINHWILFFMIIFFLKHEFQVMLGSSALMRWIEDMQRENFVKLDTKKQDNLKRSVFFSGHF